MNDIITRNEVLNDGKTVHLYFNGLVGLYVAYGYSAFLLSKTIAVSASYSWDMQMPVVVINAVRQKEVVKILQEKKHTPAYYCFVTRDAVNMDEYAEWAGELREKEEAK